MDASALVKLVIDEPESASLAAGALAEPMLRALDAIHVATAASLGPIESFVSYDERHSAIARLAGLPTAAPGI